MKKRKRIVEEWTVEKLYKKRGTLAFPEYQRQDNLWSDSKKGLLIDSILQDIDIPKLYFNRTKEGSIEVIDGQQRLWAIWGFLDGEFRIGRAGSKGDARPVTFSELPKTDRDTISDFILQVTVFRRADEDYLRELFVRLQLGLLLNTGEKLHAASGLMKQFVFRKLADHRFIRGLGIPERRYARETLCAQIAINSFARAKVKEFARTRYEDLLAFFQEYERPQGKDATFFESATKQIIEAMSLLWKTLGDETAELRNRSFVLSVYLLFEEVVREKELKSVSDERVFQKFVQKVWKRLKEEGKAGMGRRNRELYEFDTMLSSAPGERYQIERRHERLREFFEYFRSTGKVKGDR
jgi:hypothetical protein